MRKFAACLDCVFYQEGKGKFDFESAAEARPLE
jgi:hypothetical protein